MGFNYVTMTLYTNQLGFIWYSNKCVNSKSHAYLSNYKRFSVRRNLHFRPFFTTIRHWDKILSDKDTEKDMYKLILILTNSDDVEKRAFGQNYCANFCSYFVRHILRRSHKESAVRKSEMCTLIARKFFKSQWSIGDFRTFVHS